MSSLVEWAPLLALLAGGFAGLGALRSAKLVFVLGCIVCLLQIVGWTALIVIAEAKVGHDWNNSLGIGFFFGVLIVTPYTTIGAVVWGAIVGLLVRYAPRD